MPSAPLPLPSGKPPQLVPVYCSYVPPMAATTYDASRGWAASPMTAGETGLGSPSSGPKKSSYHDSDSFSSTTGRPPLLASTDVQVTPLSPLMQMRPTGGSL